MKVTDRLQQLEEQARGKLGAENSKVMQHQTKSQAWDGFCCDELLFSSARAPLALLARGPDVSYHPNIHISPAPKLLTFLHILCSASSTVQVLQAYVVQWKSLSPSAFMPWHHKTFDKQKKAVDRAGSFRPTKAREARDRTGSFLHQLQVFLQRSRLQQNRLGNDLTTDGRRVQNNMLIGKSVTTHHRAFPSKAVTFS